MKKLIAIATASLVLVAVTPTASLGGADARDPKVRFSTEDGAVLVSAAGSTSGVARDTHSGIKRVKVIYCSGSRADDGGWTCKTDATSPPVVTERAELDCTAGSRRCNWTAAAPAIPGNYLAFAMAKDRAGNEAVAGPIEVIVV